MLAATASRYVGPNFSSGARNDGAGSEDPAYVPSACWRAAASRYVGPTFSSGARNDGPHLKMRPVYLENRERVDRKAGSAVDRHGRDGQHEVPALQPGGGFREGLQILVVEQVHAEPCDRGLVNRQP